VNLDELAPPGPILLLGGTAEGRALATELDAAKIAAVSSLAGRVAAPQVPPGTVRVGGFGGPDGLAEYLVAQNISAVVDATHPFASGITANAALACARTGTPLLVLRRPPWFATDRDRWTAVPDLPSAAIELANHGPDASVLLTIGRQGVSAFSAAPQRFWLRAIDPPEGPLAPRTEVILDRGPYAVDAEIELLQRLSIDVLVTKNSGGTMTAAKLEAARELDLPVIIVDRPALPADVQSVDDVRTALEWLYPAGLEPIWLPSSSGLG
jgi:precorrin-6A/cobalt-precorrin-6A reductase